MYGPWVPRREGGCWTQDLDSRGPGSFPHLTGVFAALDVAGTQVSGQHYVLRARHVGAHVVEMVTGARIQQRHPYSLQRSPVWKWHWGGEGGLLRAGRGRG